MSFALPTEATNSIMQALVFIKQQIDFITSAQVQQYFFIPKVLFIVFGCLFVICTAYLLKRTDWFDLVYKEPAQHLLAFSTLGAKEWQKRWQKIKKNLTKGAAAYYKICLLEAEKFIYEILGRMGFPGKTMAEEITKAQDSGMEGISDLSDFYKLCEDMVADPDYHLTLEKTESEIKKVEDIFKKWGVLKMDK
ncbi:MAG: hypothetical protein M1127_03045 [Patescibacteria group bacterium]|nr:hypothetical protein [Patescibacteria group bacterium]